MAQLRKTRASAVFVPAEFTETISPALIRVANPAKAFERVVLRFAPEPVQFAPGHPPDGDNRGGCETRRARFHPALCGDRARGDDWR